MPPLPTIPNVFRVALGWTGPNSSSAVNVMHFLGAPGTVNGLWTTLQARVTQAMWGLQAGSSVIKTVTITPLDGGSASSPFAAPSGVAWAGGVAGDGIPQSATVIKLKTGQRGRDRRGRLFLPFSSEGILQSGIYTAASIGPVQTAWDNFRLNMAVDGFALVVASYTYSRATLVDQCIVEAAPGTIRRRQSRVRKAIGL